MKSFKKILAFLLILCMSASVIFQAFAFTDVNDACVESLTEKGIIKGYSKDSFYPDDACTRGQFLTFLWRASGQPKAEKSEQIIDITGDEYYAEAVWWAYKNDIAKIYADGTFKADMPTDREHAAYYLYKWADLFEKSDVTKVASTQKYLEDGVSISIDCRHAFAWALGNGILSENEDGLLKPKDAVTRLWTVNAIAALLDNHMCVWSEWENNGDGTHSRVCTKDSSHKETKEHNWNDGELTLAPTESEKGLITYTCHDCKLTKETDAMPGTKFTTRKDAEEAIVSTVYAYFSKGIKIQYEATDLSDLSGYVGGIRRETPHSSPEFVTKDTTMYTVCSDFTHQCYYESLGIEDFGDTTWPFGFTTTYMHRNAENQAQEQITSTSLVEPITDEDVDACLFRWMNFDEYKDYKEANISVLESTGVFNSPGFTDFTTGLIFKDDGYEGEIHYSYYDENGNRLGYEEAREKYLDPYALQIEKAFRPGDLYVNYGHAMIYVGNGRFIDAGSTGGGKIDLETGVDKIEPKGSLLAGKTVYDWITGDFPKMFTVLRPLEFVVKMGYDQDPGNDIIINLDIPEKSKSRIKYPLMDIDRTVDITTYGTAVKGENLTYTIEIFNKSNNERYYLCTNGKEAEDYENLVVTEKIPEGCEFVPESIVGGGSYENGTITWNIAKVAPGESVKLSYSVKVTADVGDVIVNDGGMVDNIPSNTIKNTVGGAKLDEIQKTALAKFADSEDLSLNAFGGDTAFANAIYKAIGKELSIPSAGEITKALFPVKPQVKRYGELSLVLKSATPIYLYSNRETIAKENKYLEQMLVKYFWGGRKFYVGDELCWEFATNCIKEFKNEYLEAGDIIIYAKAKDKNNLSYDFDTVCVMVYDGKNLLSSITNADGTTYEIIDESNIIAHLTKLYMKDKDIFFALRPSQIG